MYLNHLRVNHLENPIGYAMDYVQFSWQVAESDGCYTVASRIQVSTQENMAAPFYDGGWRTDNSSLGTQVQITLQPSTRYYWTVAVRDDIGQEATSAVQFFETPTAQISATLIQAPFSAPPLFVKSLHVAQEVQSARLSICGVGLYQASLNGEKIGEDCLAPFYNAYDHWLQFQTYDVTNALLQGHNELSVMLGHGWYMGRMGWCTGAPGSEKESVCLYGDTMQLLCELVITLQDGTIYRIASDESWQCTPSPLVFSDIYDGEIFDSRMVLAPTEQGMLASYPAQFSPVVPSPQAQADIFMQKLQPRQSLPLKIMEIISPIAVLHTPAGETVLDFGQNMTGWVQFTCQESRDSEILLQFGEILQQGNFYNENLRTAKQEYKLICDGSVQTVCPVFTFFGFRYIKVTGIEHISLSQFKGLVIYSQMEETGCIETSDAKVNRLFANTLWGQKGNFLDAPTDCPQRDERLGWTGDAQMFCAAANYNMYTPAFYDKYLSDMRYEQKELGGAVPYVIPDILRQRHQMERRKHGGDAPYTSFASCAWGDAATIIPWQLYRFFGDKAMLRKQYENMKMWVDYLHSVVQQQEDSNVLWRSGMHFADWLALDTHNAENLRGGTDMYYIASAYYMYSAQQVAKAATVLERPEDAQYYTNVAVQIKQALQQEYFTATGRLAIPTQTAHVVALYFDFVPAAYQTRIVADLKALLAKENNHLTTGFVGTPYLCPTLSAHGLAQQAYTLLCNEDYPSWLYEVNMGATTIWERWNSVLPDGSMNPAGMNSLNHYAYGSIVEWMYGYMGGIRPVDEAPGFAKFVIQPVTDSRFGWVKVSYQSPFGLIESCWNTTQAGVTSYEITVPFDTEATFILTQKAQKVLCNGVEDTQLLKEKEITLRKGHYQIIAS